MNLKHTLVSVLEAPDIDNLWQLRGDLLESGVDPKASVWGIIEQFRHFLQQLSQSTTAKEYSHLASLLDIGGVGGVLLQNLMEAEDASDLSQRLLSAVLSESLMVLASRQHVKAWASEFDSLYQSAGWDLFGRVWDFSQDLRPDLASSQRRTLVDQLLNPVLSTEVSGEAKAVLIGKLYQMLLVHQLTRLLPNLQKSAVQALD